MNIKNRLFCLALSLFLSPLAIAGLRQRGEPKRGRITVRGRIVGYSIRSALRPMHGKFLTPPHDEFLFLVERGGEDLEGVRHIKIRYRVTQQHQESLPSALFQESVERTFALNRDETCDEATESFVYGDKGRDAKAAKRFPNLVRLQGAEEIPLPEGRVLRCYSFDWDGFEK